MVLSMTGFGSANLSENGFTTEVEIRCLNSKFLDLNLRIPKVLNQFEPEIREMIQKKLVRGKVNLVVDWREVVSGRSKVSINRDLLKEYYDELTKAREDLNADSSDLFKIALGMPDVIETPEDEAIDLKWELTKAAIEKSLVGVHDFRSNEGGKLADAIDDSLNKISETLVKVKELAKEREGLIRERIGSALEELVEKNVDKNRFEQELIYYLEKLDIEEEVVRLKSHLHHFKEVMEQDSNGKRLNFISQEMGREINTMGAKANHAEIQKSVVDMKEELEKIREQIQNIL